MKSLSKYPVPFCCFHCPTIFSSLGSLILGEQILHIDESEDQLALSNNKPSFKLTRVPLLLLHNSVFLLHLPFLIFLSARKPPPQPPEPHFHCFFFRSSSTITTLLLFSHHHHLSIVFTLPPPPPPPPPHSNAYFHHYHHIPMRILVLMFSAFTYSILAGKDFGFVSKNCMRQNTTHSSYPT